MYKINKQIQKRMDGMISSYLKERVIENPVSWKFGSKLGRSFSPLTLKILDMLEEPTAPRSIYMGKNDVERRKITQALWHLGKQKYIIQLPDGRLVRND